MSRTFKTLLCIISPLCCFLLYGSALAQEHNFTQLEKMRAFTKTFGYVRYFHPSDQAALVEWDEMAYFGTKQVLQSDDKESISELLTKIFGPIVIDLEIYEGQEKPRPKTESVAASEIVAWQHIGVGNGMSSQSRYKSSRLNRSTKAPVAAAPFGNLLQALNVKKYREKEIRYRFKAKIEEGKCRLQGWFRVDRESGGKGLFDNMDDRPVLESEWKDYELVGTVDKDAKHLYVGVFFSGVGTALVDDVRLQVKEGDEWKAIDLVNPDFELGDKKPEGWGIKGSGYSIVTTREDAVEGKAAVQFSRGTKQAKSEELFSTIPEKGEVIDAEVAANLRIRMPLTLPVDSRYETGDDEKTDLFLKSVKDTDVESVDEKTMCLANTVLLWNVFQHFYPYFEQVDCDWNQTLTDALTRGQNCDSRDTATETLQWVVAQLHDGHGMVFDVTTRSKIQVAQASFGWVEDQLVVIASKDPKIKAGDVVTRIADQLPQDYLAKLEELISGSPQWKRARSTHMISRGTENVDIELMRNGEEAIKTQLVFKRRGPAKIDKGDKCRELVKGDDGDNIWYIDLGRVEPQDVQGKIKEFANAKGIVLDLRGYPRGTQFLFQHMTDTHMQSQQWQIPKQIRPDRIDIDEIETSGRWEMPPRKPRFKGKMVFITDASAISYAESCMSIVANYKLGEIIGSPTAGANGNVNPFALPGGYRVSWTGMRVMNHDDSQHHVRGVQPTIPMKPTLEGIRQEKDELLEKAIELISAD